MPQTRVPPGRPPAQTPVFLDRSGRRRRLTRIAGSSLAGLLVVTIAALVAAVSGASSGGPPHLPDAGYQVDASPAPVPPPPARTNPPPTDATAAAEDSPTGAPTPTPSPSSTKPGRGPDHTPPHPSKSR